MMHLNVLYREYTTTSTEKIVYVMEEHSHKAKDNKRGQAHDEQSLPAHSVRYE